MLKYEQAAKRIEAFIKDEQLKQGDKLPIIDQLTEQFSVSKTTIIKALEVLEIKGLIYQVRGSGIFVRQSQRPGFINLTGAEGFANDLAGFDLKAEVLSLETIKADEKLQEVLKLSPDDEVYCLKRQRLIEGLPYCLEESYYAKRHVLYLNEEIARASVFTYLQEDLKLTFGFADIYFRISNLSKEHAPLLKQKENDATLLTESIYYLHNGEPFNYSVLRYHKDQAQFFVPSLRY